MILWTLMVLQKGQIKGLLIREDFETDDNEKKSWRKTALLSCLKALRFNIWFYVLLVFLFVYFLEAITTGYKEIYIFLIACSKCHLLQLPKIIPKICFAYLLCKEEAFIQTCLSEDFRDNLESRSHNKPKEMSQENWCE